MTDLANATAEQTRKNVQAHILRAAKFKIGNKPVSRNWSLFFFFRILPQAELDAMIERMRSVVDDKTDDKKQRLLWQDFAQPALVNAGLVDQLVTYGSAPSLSRIPPHRAQPIRTLRLRPRRMMHQAQRRRSPTRLQRPS